MGTIFAADTIARARLDLVDPDEATWSDQDLLDDYNEALRALVGTQPDAYTLTLDVDLVAGTVQTIPADGQVILDVLENVGGKAITPVDRRMLDARNRNWPAMTATALVAHWMSDPRNPREWRNYPPNDGTGSAKIVYGAIPSDSPSSEPIPVEDTYEPAVYAYLLGAAYRRNTTRQDLAKADGYFQRFLALLGLGAKAQIAVAPRVGANPGAA